jgi:hypothetical protein
METTYSELDQRTEPAKPAVSWGAILAGTAGAIATTLILVTLGSGLGFASVSPWADSGASVRTLGIAAAIWLIVVQWISSGVGGFLAGRLRTRWFGTHVHEVFFRDTAHGLVTWAVATLILATALAGAAAGTARVGALSAARIASGAAQGTGSSVQSGTTLGAYDIDKLFRPAAPGATPSVSDGNAEASRILTKGLVAGDVPAEDRSYLASAIAGRAGISQQDARMRVDDLVTQVQAADLKAREAADSTRKAAATAATLAALSMLIGAFIACIAAVLGGRERDLHP